MKDTVRERQKQRAIDLINEKPGMTTAQLGAALGYIPAVMGMLLTEMAREKTVSQIGWSRGGEGVKWMPYQEPTYTSPSFSQYRPPKPTVIPVRRFGRIAPDIYEQTIALGGNEE